MNQQIQNEEVNKIINKNSLTSIIISVIITALISILLMSVYFNKQNNFIKDKYENKIINLEKQLSEQQSQTTLNNTEEEADVATKYCQEMGGEIIIHKTPGNSGSLIPYCNFGEKYNECEKWNFFNKHCEKKEKLERVITDDGYMLYNIEGELVETVNKVNLKDEEIFFYKEKKGYIKDGKIFITFNDDIVSFNGDIKNIEPHVYDGNNNFYYSGLEISKTFKGPYIVYNKVNPKNITFVCDSPLADYNEKDFSDLGRSEVNWQYCETNGTNFLTQYEFTAADGLGIATGGDFGESWKKIYIKKIKEKKYIFIGNLIGESLGSDPGFYEENYMEKHKYISSKKYLDEILNNEKNKIKIKTWNDFVDSFNIED